MLAALLCGAGRPGAGAPVTPLLAIHVALGDKSFLSLCSHAHLASMDVNALKMVALAARHGGFAAAARALNVDPSSVSRAVAGVEAALGLRLFHRTTRALSLTEAGALYLRRLAPGSDQFLACSNARGAPDQDDLSADGTEQKPKYSSLSMQRGLKK
ncbi:MAG: LysR family transcriptional regulator [Pseudomonadota bacterium]